ncbi:MAG: C39 family peptidase [bacterium]
MAFFLAISSNVYAVECGQDIPTNQQDLTSYIESCSNRIKDSQGQQKTLASTIKYFNNQISLTEAQIVSTEQELSKLEVEIQDLSLKIGSLNSSLSDLTKLFASRVRATYKNKAQNLFLSSLQNMGITDLLERIEYLNRVRDNDQKMLISFEKTRMDYDSQKTLKTKKQDEFVLTQEKLSKQKISLNQQKTAKDLLLADTKNDEVKYQQVKSSAQAQLAAFSKFVSSQGGASILNNTTRDDSGWGKYYNQRDSLWGNIIINNQNICGNNNSEECTVAGYGCLITSLAMITTYYNKPITPANIAIQSDFFSFADLRMGTLIINGVTTTRTRVGYSRSSLDAELGNGKPVIVGINRYGSSRPEHFIVVKKKEGDDYIMNDPFVENGMNIKLTSKYPLSSIAAVDRVSVN